MTSMLLFFLIQVEPNTKLFPAVFVRPTSPNLFQFELAKIKVKSPNVSFITALLCIYNVCSTGMKVAHRV